MKRGGMQRMRVFALAAMPTLIAAGYAQAGNKVSPAEVNYEAASSPLANVEMYQDINPKAPQMTKAEFDTARKIYLIGADHLASLPQWREAEALAEVAEFVVVPRPGESVTAVPAAFRIRQLTGFPLALSASQIRERVQQGRPIDHLAPPAVTEAIRNNGLYLRADLPHPDGDGFA